MEQSAARCGRFVWKPTAERRGPHKRPAVPEQRLGWPAVECNLQHDAREEPNFGRVVGNSAAKKFSFADNSDRSLDPDDLGFAGAGSNDIAHAFPEH